MDFGLQVFEVIGEREKFVTFDAEPTIPDSPAGFVNCIISCAVERFQILVDGILVPW